MLVIFSTYNREVGFKIMTMYSKEEKRHATTTNEMNKENNRHAKSS